MKHPQPLKEGGVRVLGNRIAEAGHLDPEPDEIVVDLGEAVLLPGLINAHCHLDYTLFKGAIFPGKSFPEWIAAINGHKSLSTPEEYLESIAQGFRLLLNSGCTSVFNIEAFTDLLLRMEPPPLRTWWFMELIDVRSRLNNDALIAGAISLFDGRPNWLGGFGLSPHAPYSASVELYRLARHVCEDQNMPMTTHVAESLEEHEMFVYGQGELYRLMESLGRPMDDCGHGSSLSHLMEFGLLNRGCLGVHMNYLQEYDWQAFQTFPLHVIHCPKSHAYFNRPRFQLERFLEMGLIVSLGTDSLASNDTLDMRAEIRQARRECPSIPSWQWLKMATRYPARAIGMEGELGVIRPGALADLVAFALPPETSPYEAVIQSREAPLFVMIDGKRLV
jgi:cytosine/adenosine deaminase-related metal-dependent hydrolase